MLLDPTSRGEVPCRCSPCKPQRGVHGPCRPVHQQANARRSHRPQHVATPKTIWRWTWVSLLCSFVQATALKAF